MPLFEYRCDDCGDLYDVLHKVREITEDIICPSCNSMHYKKLISIPGSAVTRSSNSRAEAGCAMGNDCCGGVCGVN